MAIIDGAWCQAEGQQFALIIDDKVQLEAVEPADRGFATCSMSGKDAMLVDVGIISDGN